MTGPAGRPRRRVLRAKETCCPLPDEPAAEFLCEVTDTSISHPGLVWAVLGHCWGVLVTREVSTRSEGEVRKIWFGLAYAAFAAVIAEPAPAQDRHKNFVECTKDLGLQIDPNAQRLQDGRVSRRWYFNSEAQEVAFQDCVARKANLPNKPFKGPTRVSR